MTAMSRPEYNVILFVAQSSAATLEDTRMDLLHRLLDSGMSHNDATALLAVFQVLAIEAGVEGPTLDLKLDEPAWEYTLGPDISGKMFRRRPGGPWEELPR